ncbi:MAG: HAD family hydrolase [Lachnospiraceae bacterium]|nr:HAD family hydrolase [Lachnospiraceae bacterium]
MRKAVIFDLDGTLSDSIMSIKNSCDAALAPLGFGPYTVEQYKYFVGDGAANLIKRALRAGGDEQLIHFEDGFRRYREIFAEHCMDGVHPYEGIRELLTALKEKGLQIAVLSNKPHQETIRVIENLFGKDYFDVIQGQKPEVAIKPSPEGVFQILEQLGMRDYLAQGHSVKNTDDATVLSKDTADLEDVLLYVGDTGTDMQTGKSAGAFTIGCLWGFRERKELEEHHADAIIENPLQLLDYID